MARRLLLLTSILLTLVIGVGEFIHGYLREKHTDIKEDDIKDVAHLEHIPRDLQDTEDVVFRGRIVKDKNNNGEIDEEDGGVASADVRLFRKTDDDPPSYVFIKGIAAKEDGSYELRLSKILAGKYYLKFRHSEEAFGKFISGDSHVNWKGNSDLLTVEYGKTYEINAGISLTGALYEGIMFFDNDADGEISARERGVSSGTVRLYRKKGKSYKLLQEVETKPDGSFEIQLSSIEKESQYYLKFLYQESTDYEYSVVSAKGNSPQAYIQEGNRYQINAGIVLPTPQPDSPSTPTASHTSSPTENPTASPTTTPTEDSSVPTLKPSPLINEVLYLPRLDSRDPSENTAFIEIYRSDTTVSLNCVLRNDKETFDVDLGRFAPSVDHPYFTIKHKATLNKPFKFKHSKGILWVRDFDLDIIDGLALICDGVIVDYVCWGRHFVGPNGTLHNAAVSSGKWISVSDFVETGPEDNDEAFMVRGVVEGDSLGRDADSDDTNSAVDWQSVGGSDSTGATPNARNIDLYWYVTNSTASPNVRRRVQGKGDCPRTATPDKVAEWTVMSFFCESFNPKKSFVNKKKERNMRPTMSQAIKEIRRAATSRQVNFVVQYNGIPWRKWGRAHLTSSRTPDFTPVANWRPDMQNTLEEYISWARRCFPAKKYMFHLLGHGHGWKGICVSHSGPNTRTYALTIPKLAGALAKLGKKFDVVFLYSCLMGGVEVAYQLRNVANYLTFSEEIMVTGKDFKEYTRGMTKGIIENRGASSKDMATFLAEQYEKAVKSSYKRYTVSVVDLRKIETVRASIDKYANELIMDMDDVEVLGKHDDNLNVIWGDRVLPPTEEFKAQDFVDVRHLALRTRGATAFRASNAAIIDPLLNALKGAVVENLRDVTERPDAYGLHIYHPSSLMQDFKQGELTRDRAFDHSWPSTTIYAQDKDFHIPVHKKDHSNAIDDDFEFPKDSSWDEFLIRFYKPTADACIEIPGENCTNKTTTLEIGQTATITGRGSSDGDPYSVKGATRDSRRHEYLYYMWDKDLENDWEPTTNPLVYKSGKRYWNCTDNNDCDRDGVDTTFDDPDTQEETWKFTCQKKDAGKMFKFMLWVWDDHHLWPRKHRENRGNNRGRHWLHFQRDNKTVTIQCGQPPSSEPTLAPSTSTTEAPTQTTSPTVSPTTIPTASPTDTPKRPTILPTDSPTTTSPIDSPTGAPTPSLDGSPTTSPMTSPTASPVLETIPTPTTAPAPTPDPASSPTAAPTQGQ